MVTRTRNRWTSASLALVLLTACSSSESSAPSTTPAPPETTTAPTSAPTTAPAPTPTTEPATTTIPSTEPPTTPPPPTTVPESSVPATTAPVPTDEELVQFCFDSEQVYLANQLSFELTDPEPDEARASVGLLQFALASAVESAPAGFEGPPTRAGEILGELAALFEEYDYDTQRIANEVDTSVYEDSFVEFDAIMTDLASFLQTACESELAVLDNQAAKLAPVMAEFVTWPLIPIANQASDIRLLVPAEWAEWVGSTTIDEVTFLEAAPSIDQFENTWDVAGVVATVSYVEGGQADPAGVLDDAAAPQDCTAVSTEPYTDPVYSGELHLFTDCGGTDTAAAVLLVTNEAASLVVSLEFQFPGGADRELLDQMLAGFAAGA